MSPRCFSEGRLRNRGAFSFPQGGSLFPKVIAPPALGGFTFSEASCAVFSPAGPDFSCRRRLSSLGGSAFSRGAFLFVPLGFASSQRRRIFMDREVDFLLLKLALRHSGGWLFLGGVVSFSLMGGQLCSRIASVAPGGLAFSRRSSPLRPQGINFSVAPRPVLHLGAFSVRRKLSCFPYSGAQHFLCGATSLRPRCWLFLLALPLFRSAVRPLFVPEVTVPSGSRLGIFSFGGPTFPYWRHLPPLRGFAFT